MIETFGIIGLRTIEYNHTFQEALIFEYGKTDNAGGNKCSVVWTSVLHEHIGLIVSLKP